MLLVFGSTPKEYVHLFAGHTDTEHCNHDREGLYFENEHHHCDFLSFTLPPFAHDAITYIITERNPVYPIHGSAIAVHLTFQSAPATRQRGPPAITA